MHRNNYFSQHREQGVVSLLTVMFFMVFISLIVMGFITIVIADQRQTIDNDLSASALAAARSGIEDGQRILMYCASHSNATGCAEALNSQNNCNAFNSGNARALVTSAALNVPIDTNGIGTTGGASASQYEQYYSCLTIQRETQYLDADLTSSNDYIQRLATTSRFTHLTLSWSVDGGYIHRTNSIAGWPTESVWSLAKYMPVIRFQTIPYTAVNLAATGDVGLNTIESNSRTVFIVPCSSSGTCSGAAKNINADVRSASGIPRSSVQSPPIIYASCSTSTDGTKYTCRVDLAGFDSSNSQYYIRASAIYAGTGKTTLTISAYDDLGNQALFDGVQPWIDVTGRANDVFKRVRSEVTYQSTIPLPISALDSAAPICKRLIVTDDVDTTSYLCDLKNT